VQQHRVARRALRSISALLALLAVAATAVGRVAVTLAAPLARPNILVVMTDDQRAAGTLFFLPKIRALMQRGGTRFSNAYATTPLCCPSRASLLTGLYAHNTPLFTPGGCTVAQEQGVGALSVESTLSAAGYRTGIFGKYLNGWPNTLNPPYFDRWAVTPAVTYGGAEWNVDGTTEVPAAYPTTFIQDEALGFIDQAHQQSPTQPWFLYLAPMAPHVPATPDLQYAATKVPPIMPDPAMRETDRTDKPPYVQAQPLRTLRAITFQRAHMLRSLLSVDDLVGTVLTHLQGLGELRDTLVVFASDNGSSWGEHGLMAGHSGPTSQGKTTPYLSSIGVPLLLRWPGHVQAGAVDRRVAGLLDLAPTILAAAGVAPSHPMDGLNLLDPSAHRARLLLEYQQVSGSITPPWSGFISRSAEYVVYSDPAGAPAFREYYLLAPDPSQLVNVLHDGDPLNDPSLPALDARLARIRACEGPACVA
jgi:arylsulfatase A-like enzyme